MELDIYGDGIGLVQYIDHMGDDRRAAASARASFARDIAASARASFARDIEERPIEDDQKLIFFLLRHGHTTPFEHSSITIRMTVPLFVRAQIFRHRTFSFNELSRRYTSAELRFWSPRELRAQAKRNLQCSSDEVIDDAVLQESFARHNRASQDLYFDLIGKGVARELARSVLPVSSYTVFWMSGNLKNWLTFFKLRLAPDVQPETKEAVEAAFKIVAELYPMTVSALQEQGYLTVPK
jgi:thymidylate synthase (FAD)